MIQERYQSLRKLKAEIEARKRELQRMERREEIVKASGNSFLNSVKKQELPPNHYAVKIALHEEIVRLQCGFVTQLALLEKAISEISNPKVRLMMSLRCVDPMPGKNAVKTSRKQR